LKVLDEINLLGKGGEWAVGAARQRQTAEELLDRFSNGQKVQMLADEVGMGKTYVALTVAISMLLGSGDPDHHGRVLILTPSGLLEAKWVREIAEFLGKLITPDAAKRITIIGLDAAKPASRTSLADLARPIKGAEIVVGRFGAGGAGTLTAMLRDRESQWANAASALASHGYVPGWKQWLRQEFPLQNETWLTRSIGALRADNTRVLWKGQTCTGRELWTNAEQQLQERAHTKDSRVWVRRILTDLARAGYLRRIQPLNLVVVDEVHNWVHGKNGMIPVRDIILPKADRALAMTATPIQLESSNLVRVFQPFFNLAPGRWSEGSPGFPCAAALEGALKRADQSATAFRQEWSMLSAVPIVDDSGLLALPEEHPFRRATDRLVSENSDVRSLLAPWFIRHRRGRGHRWVFVGSEMPSALPTNAPPGNEPHQLHPADGFPSDRAEVAQLALMRLGAIVAGQAGKPSLAASMTGCFSTIEATAKDAQAIKMAAGTIGQPYVDYITTLAQREERGAPPLHPKLQRTLDLVVDSWLHGEKVLVFCVRRKTAEVLKKLIDDQLSSYGTGSRDQSIASALRRELSPAVMDRVAQSLWLAGLTDTTPSAVASAISRPLSHSPRVRELGSRDNLTQGELEAVNLLANQLAANHLLKMRVDGSARPALEELASQIDAAEFEWGQPVSEGTLGVVARAVLYAPSAFFGPIRPIRATNAERQHKSFAKALWEYGTETSEGDIWSARGDLLEVLARHLRSTTTLARLLGQRDTSTGRLDVIVQQLTRPYGTKASGGGESLLERFSAFAVSARALSQTNRELLLREMRKELVRSTVNLVRGGEGKSSSLSFAAFNSPFTPDVLVCTQVGDQGIDLHQFCRIVIHYDLTFNPARMEQRTGRCDRIGSKAARQHENLLVVVPLLAGSYDERIYASLLQRDQTNEALIGDLSLTSELDLLDGVIEDSPDKGLLLVQLPPALFDRIRPNFAVSPVENAACPI
jgi:superfamily II DNA or RNA helicase